MPFSPEADQAPGAAGGAGEEGGEPPVQEDPAGPGDGRVLNVAKGGQDQENS